MREYYGDLWDIKADWIVITTNGFLRKDGANTMGAGCAKEAAQFHPTLPEVNGEAIRTFGNVPAFLGYFTTRTDFQTGEDIQTPHGSYKIYSFPVKHHYRENADLKLIKESAEKLYKLWEKVPPALRPTVAIPRPGCGNGNLDWDDVRPVLEKIFGDNDKFIFVHFKEDEDNTEQPDGGP